MKQIICCLIFKNVLSAVSLNKKIQIPMFQKFTLNNSRYSFASFAYRKRSYVYKDQVFALNNSAFFYSTYVSKYFGRIKSFDRNKGYGFIAPADGGPDVFVHFGDIVTSSNDVRKNDSTLQKRKTRNKWMDNKEFDRKHLYEGELVRYEILWDEHANSPKAVLVEVVSRSP